MAIDTSIYNQLDTKGIDPSLAISSYQNQIDRQNKLAQLAQQQELQGIQLSQARQVQQDEKTLRGIYAKQGNDPAAMIQSLRKAGLHSQADALIKSQQEIGQANLKAAHDRLSGVHEVSAVIAQDPANWQQHIINAAGTGLIHEEDAQHMMQQYMQITDPVAISESAKAHVIDAKALASQLTQKPLQPEVKTDANGYMIHVKPDGRGSHVLDENGKPIKSQIPASVQIFNSKGGTQSESMPPKPTKDVTYVRDEAADGGWRAIITPQSPTWQANKSKEAADRSFVQNIVPTFEKNAKQIDDLTKMPGFNNLFGRVGSIESLDLLPSTREARAELNNTMQAMELSGFSMMRSTAGSAGAMSEKEWPKMQSYFNVIKTTTDPEQAKRALEGAKAVYKRMQEIAKESYANEWGNGQFGDKTVIDRLSNHPNQTQKQGGVLHVDSKGNKAIVYPDGTYQEVH